MAARRTFNPVDYLRTRDSIEAFLKGAALEGDAAYMAYARACAAQAVARWGINDAAATLRSAA